MNGLSELRMIMVVPMYIEGCSDVPFEYKGSVAGKNRVLNMIKGLNKQSVHCTIISPFFRVHTKNIFFAGKKIDHNDTLVIFPPFINVPRLRIVSSVISTTIYLYKLIKDEQVDVIYAYNPTIYAAVPSWIISKISKIPFTLDYIDRIDSEVIEGKFKRKIASFVEQFIIRRIDGAIVESNEFKQELEAVGCKNILMLQCGVVVEKYQYGRAYSNESNEIIIIYAGTLDNIRNVDKAICAMEYVTHKDVKLVILGRGPDEEKLKNLAIEKKLTDRVFFKGFVKDEEYIKYLLKATIAINTQKPRLTFSKYGIPSKICEYMAAGKYIISTNINDDIVELLNERGFILKHDSPHEIAKTIDYILSNEEDLSYIAINAKKYIFENGTIDQNGKKMKKQLIKIIKKCGNNID